MKNFHKALSILAAAALFAGCSSYDETNDPARAGNTSVKLLADVADDAETRAGISVGESNIYRILGRERRYGNSFHRPRLNSRTSAVHLQRQRLRIRRGTAGADRSVAIHGFLSPCDRKRHQSQHSVRQPAHPERQRFQLRLRRTGGPVPELRQCRTGQTTKAIRSDSPSTA